MWRVTARLALVWALVWAPALALALSGGAAAADPGSGPAGRNEDVFFPLAALQKGMRGVGLTVVEGTEIEAFEVEILGRLVNAGPAGDLILIRVSGSVIDRTGGIAAGMSGSPVYVDGRLVGAIGYGFDMADHRIGLVTPIGDMLKTLDLVRPPAAPPSGADEGAETDDVNETDEGDAPPVVPGPDGLPEAGEASTRVFVPVSTPLMVDGMGSRGLQRLQRELGRFNLLPVQAGGAPSDAGAAPGLAPGSAFGVQLVRGDINLTAIGTVTYVEGDRFVGFGHPFINKGGVDFLATGAYVHQTVQSLRVPFKLGAPLAPVGRVAQDRGAAVAGALGTAPDTVQLAVRVRDLDLGSTREFHVEVVRDDMLTAPLAAISALAATDRAIDRIGRGTSRVEFELAGDGMPRPLVRDNMFYSDFDIAALSLYEFLEGLGMVVGNRFEPVRITGVRFDVEIEEARRTARIQEATPVRGEVAPGETVDVEVVLRPFRGPAERQVIALSIPEETVPGQVTVTVRGGGFGLTPPDSVKEPDQPKGPGEQAEFDANTQDFAELIEEFVRRERNNELIAGFYPPQDHFPLEDEAPPPEEGEDGQDGAQLPRRSPRVAASEGPDYDGGHGWNGYGLPESVKTSLSTPYVIYGSTTFTLTIVRPEPAEPEPAEPEPADLPVQPDQEALEGDPAGGGGDGW